MTIQCILFDLDNTIIDRPKSIRKYSTVFRESFSSFLGGIDNERLFQLIHEADAGGYKGKEQMVAELLTVIHWQEVPTAEQLLSHWYEHYPLCSEPMDGLFEVLETLDRSAMPMGMITNGKTTTQNQKIDILGIRRYMRCVTVSQTVGVSKPDRRIFELTLGEMGTDASGSWYVGDHPSNDILGASAAGLTAVWFRGSHDWPAGVEEPEYQIDRFGQLLGLIEDR